MKTKKIVSYGLGVVAGLLISYLLISLVLWNLNPAEWDQASRVYYVFIFLLLMMPAITFVIYIKRMSK
jgi:hypothetical protein